MKKKLIEHYREWVEMGQLSKPGLCGSIPVEYNFSFLLLTPTRGEKRTLYNSGKSSLFWASGMDINEPWLDKNYRITPLRETIILLICAMHDEI